MNILLGDILLIFILISLFWAKEGAGGGGGAVSKTQKIECYCQVSQHFCRSLKLTRRVSDEATKLLKFPSLV